MKSYSWILVLIIFIPLYLYFSITSLHNPGLFYDEALQVAPAINYLTDNMNGNFIYWWHFREFPVMTMSYIGALKTYIFIPTFYFFGVSPESIRMTTIMIGVIVLIFTYLFTSNFFDKKTALLALLFLATDSSFIFYCRIDWGPCAVMLALKVIGLFLLTIFYRKRNPIFIIITFFLFGLGIWDKANFMWIVVSLFFALILFSKKLNPLVNFRNFEAALLGLILGAYPFIAFNIKFKGATFKNDVFDFLSLFQNFTLKWAKLIHTFGGISVYKNVFSREPGTILGRSFLPELILFCLVLFLAYCLINRKKSDEHFVGKASGLLTFMLLNFFFLLITPEATGSHHSMSLYPIPHILSAAILIRMFTYLRFEISAGPVKKSFVPLLIIIPVVFITFSNLSLINAYHQSLKGIGGRGAFSPKLYDLEAYLQNYRNSRIIIPVWGINQNLISLSCGTLNLREICFLKKDEKENVCLQNMEKYEHLIFVIYSWSSKDERFLYDFAKKHGYKLTILKSISDAENQEIYKVFKLE